MAFILDEPSEGVGGKVLRNVVRSGARAATSTFGLAGDIATGAMSLGQAGQDIINKGFEAVGLGALANKKPLFNESPYMPTTENIEKVVHPQLEKVLPSGYLKPQGDIEAGIDEAIADTVALALPVGPLKGMGIKKSITLAGAGNLAKWGAKEIGLGEKGQGAVKLGTMLLASTASRGKLNSHMRELYDTAHESIPEGANLNAKPVENTIYGIREKFQDSPKTRPSLKAFNKIVVPIEDDIRNGKLDVKKAIAHKQTINEWLSREESRGAEKWLKNVVRSLNGELEAYGKSNPSFGKAWKDAEELAKSHAVTQWAQKVINPQTLGMEALALLFGGHGLASAATKVAGTAMIPKVMRGIEMGLGTSAGRKYYANLMKEAARHNAPAVIKEAKKLDNLFKSQPKTKEVGFVLD